MKTKRHITSYLHSIRFLVVMGLVTTTTLGADAMENAPPAPMPAMATLQSSYGKLPLSFEANHGQWDASVQFVTRGGGHTLFLTPSEAVLTLRTGGTKNQERGIDAIPRKTLSSPSPSSYSAVRMRFEGADSQAEMVGAEPLPGIVNYFIGDDPAKWRTNIPTYQKVEYKNLYAGIDLVYYGNQGHLEYDLVVAPGADPTQIRLAFDGAEQLTVDEQGDLVLTLSESSKQGTETVTSTLRMHKPVVYQEDDLGEKHLLAGSYVVRSPEQSLDRSASVFLHPIETQHVTFQVASYDRSKPLIIDPVLSWATYLGGSSEEGAGRIALDASSNIYLTGSTSSSDFPGTATSPIQNTIHSPEAFVTKLNAAGTAVLYSTYLGSGGEDSGRGIALDQAGNAYVTGFTFGPDKDIPEFDYDFPGTARSPIQGKFGGGRADAFVAKINKDGTALLYSTYLGGSGDEGGYGITVDATGHAYVVGQTASSNFPVIIQGSSLQNGLLGLEDAFITKVNETGTEILYSTYLGGSQNDGGRGITVDTDGNAYLVGWTESSDFPGTHNSPIQNTLRGGRNAFVTKINAAGEALVYSTYLGGSGDGDGASGIAIDTEGNAYVTGTTSSSDFPGTKTSPIQSIYGGTFDAFVTKLNVAGTTILYSSYLGGSGDDRSNGIAVDATGSAYVLGSTSSLNFPGTAGSPIQHTFGGGLLDAFVTKLNSAGTVILYSTYLGGRSSDLGGGIAVDSAGNAYVTGGTLSSSFPGTANSSLQNTLHGGSDTFVAKISSSLPFAAFDARAKIDLNERRHHGGGTYHRPLRDDVEARDYQPQDDNDKFNLTATFTLGGGSNGITPLTEPVIVQVGTFSTAIPPGSFKQYKGRYVFEGTINGVHLEAVLRSLILGNDYELKVEGRGADLTGTTNPVTVSVTIGDDSGSKAITAKIK